jgi:hypothetical protein
LRSDTVNAAPIATHKNTQELAELEDEKSKKCKRVTQLYHDPRRRRRRRRRRERGW